MKRCFETRILAYFEWICSHTPPLLFPTDLTTKIKRSIMAKIISKVFGSKCFYRAYADGKITLDLPSPSSGALMVTRNERMS